MVSVVYIFQTMWIIWYIWKLFWVFSAARSYGAFGRNSDSRGNMSMTLSKILKGYDVRLRPKFGADPLYVGIELKIAEINEFSEVNMDYTLTIFLNQYWKDDRLAFSTRDEMMTFTGDFAKRIWVPDIFFPADKDSFIYDVTEKNQMVQLHGDGSILYGMRFTTRESCQMDLRNFPLDSQNCSVEIESYGYTVRDVVMYWKDSAISGVEALKLPQFRISGYDTTDRIEKLATGVYQRLTLSLKFERHFGFFFFQMYLPSILVVMLSWVSFWISNDATAARVALGITTVLTMTTINNSVRSSLPRISYIKAIDVYLVICFLFVFAALIEYATVNHIYWERKKIKKNRKCRSKATKALLQKPKSKFKINQLKCIIFQRKHPLQASDQKKSKKNLNRVEDSGKCSIEIDEVSRGRKESSPIVKSNVNLISKQKIRLIRSASFSGPIRTDRVRSANSISTKPSFRTIRFIQSFRNRTSGISPIVQDVSSIDNYSRIIFPCSFLFFNAIYWSVYANKI